MNEQYNACYAGGKVTDRVMVLTWSAPLRTLSSKLANAQIALPPCGWIRHASAVEEEGPTSEQIHKKYEEHGIPTPIIKIDNKADNFATVVSLEFGDQLGELLDTVRGKELFREIPALVSLCLHSSMKK